MTFMKINLKSYLKTHKKKFPKYDFLNFFFGVTKPREKILNF